MSPLEATVCRGEKSAEEQSLSSKVVLLDTKAAENVLLQPAVSARTVPSNQNKLHVTLPITT